MQQIQTIIIDDEMSAILLLEEVIINLDGINVAGHARSIEEGLNLIVHHRPDIVFLDIKLNEENGFDLIHRLKDFDIDPFFVMVTGYDQFGLKALKAGAFDYLLKPVDPDELLKVISRFRQKKTKLPQPENIQKIRFNTLGGFILVNPIEILYCKAEANYTDIYLSGQSKHTISQNIGKLEEILSKPQFFRISRSIIINLKFLTEINRGKRLCILSADHISHSLTIAHDRIKELEGALIQ
jgi:two-component system, LytTR family, response regulator